MTEKLYEYQGVVGRFHSVRDSLRERYLLWKEEHPLGFVEWIKCNILGDEKNVADQNVQEDYSHIFRRKTKKELVRISAAVMGIEFSYAAETAFVSPTLLKIGVEHQHMTLVWALSPLVGFFLTPILGSLSDRCHLKIGRRRPFIFFMSLGVLLGLLLVPNGESLGYLLGDERPPLENMTQHHRTIGARLWGQNRNNNQTSTISLDKRERVEGISNFSNSSESSHILSIPRLVKYKENRNEPKAFNVSNSNSISYNNSHPWGIFFTVLGTVLLDFDADAGQSPTRAYLLDVTMPEDHARGLSTFTVMAGLGGSMGYALGGINWDETFLGELLGGHVRAVFTLITIIFVVCVAYTITSFREMPLYLLETRGNMELDSKVGVANKSFESEEVNIGTTGEKTYGSVENVTQSNYKSIEESPNSPTRRKSIAPNPNASLKVYLQSIIYMPHSIRMLCLTNLFCWMAHVCYSLYFTDFVGEAVFEGNPTAPDGSPLRDQYEAGVRFGCWGMSLYSLSCACYSFFIEKFIAKFGAKKVYMGGLLTYSTGMLLMALTKNKVGVILFSGTAGVMYSTLFTMPYLIIAHYHAKGVFELDPQGEGKISSQIRGLGTDVAIVSSMVFLAQFILSMCMGTIVSVSGTTTAVVSVATALAFFGAISATRVVYLDL